MGGRGAGEFGAKLLQQLNSNNIKNFKMMSVHLVYKLFICCCRTEDKRKKSSGR